MATSDYEKLLTEAGYTLEKGAAISLPPRIWAPTGRTPIATGQKTIDGVSVEVQLQSVMVYNRQGLYGVARVRRPDLVGEAAMRGKAFYGAIRSILTGPIIALAFLVPFLLAGVWVIMLPGFWLMLVLTKVARKDSPVVERPELGSPVLGWRYSVWAADPASARTALPAKLQETILGNGWFGATEVLGGEVLLDGPIGWGRYDLFKQLMGAAEAVAKQR
jgi:hypothetical protein